MGYEMYRLLSLKKSFATGRKKKTKKQAGPVIIDLDEEDRQQELLKGGRPVLERDSVVLLSSWLSDLAAQGNNLELASSIPDVLKLCWARLCLWRLKLVELCLAIAASKHGRQYTDRGDLSAWDLLV